jgi:exopolysaccharide biosynthesis polyprenyl glycosylphosphotransferase
MNLFRRQILLLIFKIFDLALMLFAFSLALGVHHLPAPLFPPPLDNLLFLENRNAALLFLAAFSLVWHIIFIFYKLYYSRRLLSRWREVYEILKATSAGTFILLLALFVLKKSVLTIDFIVIFWFSVTSLTVAGRLIMRYVLALARLRGHNLRFMLIVGTNNRAIEFANRLRSKKELGYSIVGFVDDKWTGTTAIRGKEPRIVAGLDNFPEFIRNNVVDEVVICLPMKSYYDQAFQIVTRCEEQGLKVHFLPTLFDLKFAKSKTEWFDGEMMITFFTGGMTGGWPLIAKRALDVAVSSLILLACMPVFAVVALMIKLNSPGPVFFVQDRVGLNKRRFRLYKFRTMIMDAEQKMGDLEELNEVSGPVFKIKDDPRIPPVGRFLRKTSIDELPQLWNVLKGDMSLVGPRPLPVRDYEGFDQDWHRRRFSVRPGITCLWQVSGRSNIPFEQWMELDMQYIDQWSLGLDLMILIRTVPAVFRASGAT